MTSWMMAAQGSGLACQGGRMLMKAILGQDQGLKEAPGKVKDSVEGVIQGFDDGDEGSV